METWIVSHVQALIPEIVQHKWRDFRAAFKKAEVEQLGSETISEHIEMASWGVEKAEERNRAEASESCLHVTSFDARSRKTMF